MTFFARQALPGADDGDCHRAMPGTRKRGPRAEVLPDAHRGPGLPAEAGVGYRKLRQDGLAELLPGLSDGSLYFVFHIYT